MSPSDSPNPRRWWISFWPPLGAVALSYGLTWWGARHPELVERIYSRHLFPILAKVVGWPGRWWPWSLGESFLIGLVAMAAVAVLRIAVDEAPGYGPRIRRFLTEALSLVAWLYAGFVLLWGLNYQRPTLAATFHWSVAASTASELQGLCEELAGEVNALRRTLPSDATGVIMVDREAVLDQRSQGFEAIRSVLAPAVPLSMRIPSRPKPAIFSGLMSRSLTYGMYLPWTGEALLNHSIPAPAVPFTVGHEMAHQLGIAREDEANFVGYLACRAHPNPLFRYSGARAALGEAMAQLAATSPEAWTALRASLEPGVLTDEGAEQAWLLERRGRFSQVQGQVYDGYLKSQGQVDGVRSYGRMVDLLLAERRLRGKPAAPD